VAFGCSSAFVRQLDLSGWSVPQPLNQASLRQEPEASGRVDLFDGTRPRSRGGSALGDPMARGQAQLALVCHLQRLYGILLATCSAPHEIKTMLIPMVAVACGNEVLVPDLIEDCAHQERVSTMHLL